MNNEELLKMIKNSIVEGDTQNAIDYAKEAMNMGVDPKNILNEAVIKGSQEVGELYEQEEYFLADLLISGDVIEAVLDTLKDSLPEKSDVSPKGNILIGTVEGDIHDLGKSVLISLLKGQGFDVIDIGTDITPEEFVEKAKEIKPKVIGLSGLLTMSISKMRETVIALKKENITSKIIVGGGILSKESCEMIGADDFAKDGWKGIKKIINLIENKNEVLE